MNTKKEKVQYAILHNPCLIPTLLKDTSISKGMIYRLLKKAVPCRIGIEFELSGNFTEKFSEKYKLPIKNIDYSKFYNVLKIEPDELYKNDESIFEIRISISDFHELKGLYKFMDDLKEFCKLHEHGGIHIHLDLSKYDIVNNPQKNKVVKYTTDRLDEIEAIFPKYTGEYNHRKVKIKEKGSYVNFSRLNTIEVRIAPLTFDYFTLMTWITKLVKFRNELIYNCKLGVPKQTKCKTEKKVIEHLTTRGDGIFYRWDDSTDIRIYSNQYISNQFTT